MLNFDVYLYQSSSDSFLIYKKKKKLEFGKGVFGYLWLIAGGLWSFVGDFWLFAGDLWSFTGSSQLSFAGGLWWFPESSWSIVGGLWWFVVVACNSNCGNSHKTQSKNEIS